MSPTASNGDEDNRIKYTRPNDGLADCGEWIQYLNRVVSLTTCIILHIHIILRLLIANKIRQMNDYQKLIIVQSIINILACSFEMVLNEIQTSNINYVKIGHSWWHFTRFETIFYTISMVVTSNSTQDFLMLFNLHRLVLIKNGKLLRMYCMALPLMVIGMYGDISDSYSFVEKGQDVNLFYKYTQLPIIATVIIYCYVRLQRDFKTNQNMSETTKKLQKKLSTSILLQIILSGVVWFVLYFVPWVFNEFGDPEYYTNHIVMYIILSSLVTQWYSLISVFLITWSISGFFHNHTPTHSAVKVVQEALRNPPSPDLKAVEIGKSN
ncbi:G_PROTEIN_RECEP_F1_2 domain-containing protein [Caenorhabditis elegans]|uniref:G_PROTEIN_RECEP_F1_2 domain-containing protein n=1 Tax=Caenorhabditis elegans TaxID=6239 RepID=Q9XUW4_CAEEL|nr:G_PROTEIN_RECEP_F1_2 domain-containing protein [Caenorhabditis elegans]CAB04529.3 G_PROTEIN_RECEP_F1_2 domain-containing protein [Caenorhabditis elegans]|eukprot:NP_001352243.1 Uncharacterized protein CELE_F59A1.12 [Caenorhabditis elegans]